MATVDGLTKARMLEIEANAVVDGEVVGDDLILTTHGGDPINAGNVRGPAGEGGGSLVHPQSFATASTDWDFTHDFGTKAVSVYTENSFGVEIEGDISYPSDDILRVTFFHAQTGSGRVWT